MKYNTKGQMISSLHKQMIENKKLYQDALKNDEQFSVLKGLKIILKELRSRLEKKLI